MKMSEVRLEMSLKMTLILEGKPALNAVHHGVIIAYLQALLIICR